MSKTNESLLHQYLQSIQCYGMLTADEEIELANRMHDTTLSDHERAAAREKFINSNLRLVVYIAKNYRNSHLDPMDIISAGNIGLITAVDRFDPSLGYRFSTSAAIWIKQSITKSIIDCGKMIRIPAHIFQLQAKYRAALAKLEADGKRASIEAIAAEMGTTVGKAELARDNLADAVSMDKRVDDSDADSDTIADLVADNDAISPMEYADQSETHDRIQRALESFDDRTAAILKMRYGLGDAADPADWSQEHTLEEVGTYVGLTRERVRQIEKKAITELRAKLADLANFIE